MCVWCHKAPPLSMHGFFSKAVMASSYIPYMAYLWAENDFENIVKNNNAIIELAMMLTVSCFKCTHW